MYGLFCRVLGLVYNIDQHFAFGVVYRAVKTDAHHSKGKHVIIRFVRLSWCTMLVLRGGGGGGGG